MADRQHSTHGHNLRSRTTRGEPAMRGILREPADVNVRRPQSVGWSLSPVAVHVFDPLPPPQPQPPPPSARRRPTQPQPPTPPIRRRQPQPQQLPPEQHWVNLSPAEQWRSYRAWRDQVTEPQRRSERLQRRLNR